MKFYVEIHSMGFSWDLCYKLKVNELIMTQKEGADPLSQGIIFHDSSSCVSNENPELPDMRIENPEFKCENLKNSRISFLKSRKIFGDQF